MNASSISCTIPGAVIIAVHSESDLLGVQVTVVVDAILRLRIVGNKIWALHI